MKLASMLLQTMSEIACKSMQNFDALGVAIARDDARLCALEETGKLPCCRTTLRVSAQALLRHDGDSVAVGTSEVGEDIVPDVCLVLLLQTDETSVGRMRQYVAVLTFAPVLVP